MKRPRFVVAGLIALLCLAAAPAVAQWATFPKGMIRVGDRAITVELARTTNEQRTGLMFRDELAADEGMVFLYAEPRYFSYWMRNTRIPLSIAFIDESGTIFQIEDMKPFSEDLTRSTKPGLAVLEMNRGWFEKNDVAVGTTVDLSPLAEAGLWPPSPAKKPDGS